MNTQPKQLFFSEAIQSPFPEEQTLVYEPFWQLGIMREKEAHLKRLERLLGVESSSRERKQVQMRLNQQKQAIQSALARGEVIAWVGPSAGEELAFMELAETLEFTDRLFLRVVYGPLQMRERAPELLARLAQYIPYSKEEWQTFVPFFSEVERDVLIERKEAFVHHGRQEDYFDVELLTLLAEQEHQMPSAKLLGQMYGRRPEYPLPFYMERIRTLIEKGHMNRVGNKLVIHPQFQLTEKRS